jgi:uncharacterized repeat protein (TIGR01451 family)
MLAAVLFFSAFPAASQEAHAVLGPGTVRVCKTVFDSDGNLSDGAFASGSEFKVAGIDPAVDYAGAPAGILPVTQFTLPLFLNTDLYDNYLGNDAYCVTYAGLPFGIYYYDREEVVNLTYPEWHAPMYDDGFVTGTYDFFATFPYSAQYYTPSQDNPNYHESSDGFINLNSREPEATLVVFNAAYDRGSAALPDLAVTRGAYQTNLTPGQIFTYKLYVKNKRLAAPAYQTMASHTLPSLLEFVSASTTRGTYYATSGLWSIGRLLPGESAEIKMTTRVKQGPNSPINNFIHAWANFGDFDFMDNGLMFTAWLVN